MSTTYGLMNLISSFGFTYLWRKACINSVKIQPSDSVYDLMTGMGELFPQVSHHLGPHGQLIGIDFSANMCKQARANAAKLQTQITVLEQDVLDGTFAQQNADVVVSSFGLKTFSDEQLQRLAQVTFQLLKSGGHFSFIEISVPKNRLLKFFYLIYLNKVIPRLGSLFLGNPDNYRQLGIYTQSFGSSQKTKDHFTAAGLITEKKSYFFGCATGVSGRKP